MGIDLVTDLHADQLRALAAELEGEFYTDVETMEEAWKHGRAFNAIRLASSYKIDIFPLGRDEYSQEAFRRRRLAEAPCPGGEAVKCSLATAEDTILNKLRGYEAGGEISEVQWRDLQGIVRASGDRLDREYLDHWAARLNLADLLDRLLKD